MQAPDGGWYDETPPRVIGTVPAENAVNAHERKIRIYFNEYVKMDQDNEKIVVSPPQMEQPNIASRGKYILVELLDSLKSNTTYTIDFSDAISDNNEGNPLGNYTYSFSTGDHIDTLEISGTVLNAEDLEPIKGMLVGLHKAPEKMPTIGEKRDTMDVFMRIARTDSRGHFIMRGLAPGRYVVSAVQDADGDYRFTQKSETMAFSYDVIVPTSAPDVRQDTLWADELHIKDISTQKYTHFYPDDIVLRAFNHALSDRNFVKWERKDPESFTLFFTAPIPESQVKDEKERLPKLHGLNFSEKDAFIVEPSEFGDTITYWLKDTALVNQDTLHLEMQTLLTDSLGKLVPHTDTLEILAKTSYAKRLKRLQDKKEEWEKKLAKKRRSAAPGEVIDSIMPPQMLTPEYDAPQYISPNGVLKISFDKPLARFDSTAIHLYVKEDSTWYHAPFVVDKVSRRQYQVYSEWIPGAYYSFEVDTLAFEDIYGHHSAPYKAGVIARKLDDFASLFVDVVYNPMDSTNNAHGEGAPDIIVQLLDANEKVVSTSVVKDGTAEFYYITPNKYYLRAIIDSNHNGRWDTGDYYAGRQPEYVYYFNEEIECIAKRDLSRSWNLTQRKLDQQKPGAITKQKAEAEKTIQQRNAKRAAEKGLIYIPDGR